jgi:transcriptional regulator with XRE-family HTH domain
MKSTMHTNVDAAVGAQIAKIRRQQSVGIPTLAESLGVSAERVAEWEIGAVRLEPEELFACARFFGVPPSAFFSQLQEEFSPQLEDYSAPQVPKYPKLQL